MKCEIGEQLILKQNPSTNTGDLCPYVLAGNANEMATRSVNHFLSLNWCNQFAGWVVVSAQKQLKLEARLEMERQEQ